MVVLDHLTAEPPALIEAAAQAGYVQLCDGPATMPPEGWLEEGSRQRRLPGEGEFPLHAFAASLPPGVPIGLEIPLRNLAERGIGPIERARMALSAARPYLALAPGDGR